MKAETMKSGMTGTGTHKPRSPVLVTLVLAALILSLLVVGSASAQSTDAAATIVGNVVTSIGDPHETTADGLKYDNMETGTFIKQRAKKGDFELQSLHETSTKNSGQTDNTAVGVKVNETGSIITVHKDGAIFFGNPPKEIKAPFAVPGGGQVEQEGNLTTITSVAGDKVELTKRTGCYLDIRSTASPERRDGEVAGSLGQLDSDTDFKNDLVGRGGQQMTDIKGFIEEWRTKDGESMFGDSTTLPSSCTADTTKPEISGLPTSDLTQKATGVSGASVSFPSITAYDTEDGDVPVSCASANGLKSGDTFPLGSTEVTCSAKDAANNETTGSFNVNVTYSWSGVLQPINGGSTSSTSDDDSSFKLGSTVPVKFKLTGDSAGITDATATLHVTKVGSGTTGESEAASTAASTSGNLFRYDAENDQYIFNWGTKGLETGTGTYSLRIDLGDGTSNTVLVSLK